ncbi:hypothetical protein AA13595_0757 [Gluconacetobacter johannae DSM 13595]|uniref:Uncharacterized protein n=1 Tax=Gluconacetobacter johannae TaxID=112140 RepID=A0A7W4J9M5_9PROT|nr:hypothetical protein [Gluconacetobacter johannae]MBB2177228.1 hypothetical protein [Gluconacetobacter johannae]GBQ81846.1 hypothetical protein AA13595_0757 [Gluconacetobacter johannae DSM 13595]
MSALSVTPLKAVELNTATGPVQFLHSTPLPDITEGGFDHFAVDKKDNLLLIMAEKHASVEMFRLSDGTHLASAGGFGFPHTPAYVAAQHQLFVADDKLGAVLVVDVPSLKIVGRIPLRKGPDEAVFDKKAGLFYVGNGGKHDNSDNSSISVIDVAAHKEIARIAIPSNNVESMVVDHDRKLLFANLRDTRQIAVVDLRAGRLKTVWNIPGLNMNTPLAYDSKTQRLFSVGRKPGKLFVVDATNGALLSTADSVDTADGAIYDDKNKRLYVSGAEGLSVFHRDDADHFSEIQRIDTRTGKVSAYVGGLKQLYIARARTPGAPAALDIYTVAQEPAPAKAP